MDKVVRKAMKHCRKIFQNSRCEKLTFHNIAHTLEVYDNVKKIGAFGMMASRLHLGLLIGYFVGKTAAHRRLNKIDTNEVGVNLRKI